MMEYFTKKSFEWFVTKVATTITDYRSNESKAQNIIVVQTSYHHLVIMGSARSSNQKKKERVL